MERKGIPECQGRKEAGGRGATGEAELVELGEAAENSGQEDTAVQFHHLQTQSPALGFLPA